MTGAGVRIRAVEPESIGARLGLCPGDEIVAVNGHPVPDELALKFHLASGNVDILFRKPSGEELTVSADADDAEPFGVSVDEFKTRTCSNACLFCFIDQLPPDARPNLKIKDDDYRLSFLHGNYITLTNLGDRELDRIIEQALSPLYVSVHATDPELRTRLLGRRKVDGLDHKFRKLLDGGIRVHAQIVLMPEINDGHNLEKTVKDLFGYYPGVASVAIVPLGLSDHGPARHQYQPVTAGFCKAVIAQAQPWQKAFRAEVGQTFAYLADEFYIQGGVDLPGAEYYDDYAQIEDGVGLVRRFLDDFAAELARRRRTHPGLSGTLVTGRLFYPYLRDCISRLNRRLRSDLRVVEVENRFMGSRITVAGLLGGRDILTALRGTDPGDFILIPSEAVSRVDGILVDNMTPGAIAAAIGRPVIPGGRSARELFRHVPRISRIRTANRL